MSIGRRPPALGESSPPTAPGITRGRPEAWRYLCRARHNYRPGHELGGVFFGCFRKIRTYEKSTFPAGIVGIRPRGAVWAAPAEWVNAGEMKGLSRRARRATLQHPADRGRACLIIAAGPADPRRHSESADMRIPHAPATKVNPPTASASDWKGSHVDRE